MSHLNLVPSCHILKVLSGFTVFITAILELVNNDTLMECQEKMFWYLRDFCLVPQRQKQVKDRMDSHSSEWKGQTPTSTRCLDGQQIPLIMER